jgi:hypothetical protein
LQLGSVITESIRLALVQALLQQHRVTLNPVSTLYYIAPISFIFLLIPFSIFELPRIVDDPGLVVRPELITLTAAAAFGAH